MIFILSALIVVFGTQCIKYNTHQQITNNLKTAKTLEIPTFSGQQRFPGCHDIIQYVLQHALIRSIYIMICIDHGLQQLQLHFLKILSDSCQHNYLFSYLLQTRIVRIWNAMTWWMICNGACLTCLVAIMCSVTGGIMIYLITIDKNWHIWRSVKIPETRCRLKQNVETK